MTLRRRIADIAALAATVAAPCFLTPAYAKPFQPLPLSTAIAADDDDDAASPLTVVASLSKSGPADLVQAQAAQPGTTGTGKLIVLLGRNDGKYDKGSILPLPGGDPRAIVTGDLNGDGISDVIVGDGSGALNEYFGDGHGGLVSAGEIAHFSSVVSLAMADFNRDGKLDLAVSDSHTGTVSILFGGTGGTFSVGWSFRLPMPGAIYRLAAADFNHDGLPDLAVTNDDGDAYDVMLGNGNGTFTESPELSHLKDPNAHCVA